MPKKSSVKTIAYQFRCTVISAMQRCGKPGCRCEKGLLHGPYYYARLTDSEGKRKTIYMGKQLEEQLSKIRDAAFPEE